MGQHSPLLPPKDPIMHFLRKIFKKTINFILENYSTPFLQYAVCASTMCALLAIRVQNWVMHE